MEPTAIIAVEFEDGSVGKMQCFFQDVSDERIEREVRRGAWTKPVAGWSRAEARDFPSHNGAGWERRAGAIVARPAPEPAKDSPRAIAERLDAIEAGLDMIESSKGRP